ncbi:GNAT family N-acetyltransferase [Flavobacterium enshiense]|uniref:GNAT family N-acetyltransferase n=1 Tax=Flavobacterium enshiense TaxID=1341165 RepID=UPI00345CF5FE
MKLQLIIENDILKLLPLEENDFETLFKVASDPLIWEQHPNKDRYKSAVFQTFFEGAIVSKGAFLILDKRNNTAIGSTRFYNYDEDNKSIFIGYTFYSRSYWGSQCNAVVKKMMLDYIFQFVDKVYFHIGAQNIRSQKAIEKIGAEKVREVVVAYHGEPDRLNFEYVIEKQNWTS